MGVSAAVGLASQAPPSPLVVALDSSRSLQTADLRRVVETLDGALEGLQAPNLPVGLVTFDDTARWVVRPTEDRARFLAALGAVQPSGTTTVLLDGIYLAARELPTGGTVLVISDGKDENSAVTVEDIKTLCDGSGVVLLTAGVGRNVDDRSLRRLALVTGGAYLGARVDGIEASLQEAVSRRTSEPGVESPPAPADEPAAFTVPQQTPPADNESVPADDSIFRRLPRIAVTAAVGAVVFGASVLFWWLFMRTKAPPCCAACGHPLTAPDEDCPECRLNRIRAAAESEEIAAPPGSPPDRAGGYETHPGQLDPTMVLGELATLTVKEEGRQPQIFPLPKDRIFAVGRGPKTNTLQVRDQTVSTQHFKIVYKEGHYYVVDLWTTNGTSVNHEFVRVHCLESGDVIRAGMTEFVFDTKVRTPAGGADTRTAPPPLRK